MILQRWSPLQRDMRLSGKVKWFNAKGYGFILAEGRDEDLFAHYSAIQMDGYKTLKAGQPVNFEIIQGPKGLHAINISPATATTAAPSAPARRSRRRRPSKPDPQRGCGNEKGRCEPAFSVRR